MPGRKALKDEYEKAIADADKLYQQKSLTRQLKHTKKQPPSRLTSISRRMIRKIKQYIVDHAILDLNKTPLVHRLQAMSTNSTLPVEPKLRSNNYVMIGLRLSVITTPKVYFNYGRDNAKNGYCFAHHWHCRRGGLPDPPCRSG
jgi:hypothetical protein